MWANRACCSLLEERRERIVRVAINLSDSFTRFFGNFFISWIQPTWAPDEQAEIVLQKDSFSWKHSNICGKENLLSSASECYSQYCLFWICWASFHLLVKSIFKRKNSSLRMLLHTIVGLISGQLWQFCKANIFSVVFAASSQLGQFCSENNLPSSVYSL